jgi:hypothetical protein
MEIDLDGESWFSGDFKELEFYFRKNELSHLKIISLDETPINIYAEIGDLVKMRDQLNKIITKVSAKKMNINTIIRAKEETFRNKVFQEDDNS